MSEVSLSQFLTRVVGDATLQDQLKGVTEPSAFTEALVRLGNQNGFQFTAAEVNEVLVQNKRTPPQELTDADLAHVAGGRPAATSDGCGGAWTTLFGPCGGDPPPRVPKG